MLFFVSYFLFIVFTTPQYICTPSKICYSNILKNICVFYLLNIMLICVLVDMLNYIVITMLTLVSICSHVNVNCDSNLNILSNVIFIIS